ncbi:MAG: L-lactate permease [bacterium]
MERYKDIVMLVTAVLPLIWLCYALISRLTKPYVACLISLSITVIVSIYVWKLSPNILYWSILDGILSSIYPIIWTIFSALFTYRLLCEIKAIDGIRRSLSGISNDRLIQAVIVAFCFGSLLEGIAGFGTSVIVPSAILVSLGFPPYQSAVISLISNTVPVVYAAVGVPVIALANTTGLPLKALSGTIGLQLFPVTLIIPLFIRKEIRTKIDAGFIVATGLVFALTQSLVGWYIGPELPAILAPFLTIGFIIGYLKLKNNTIKGASRRDILAWTPYALIVLFILITRFNSGLGRVLSSYPYSFILHIRPLNKMIRVDLLYTPGSIIMFSAILGGILLKARLIDYKNALKGAFFQILPTFSIITSMIVMADIMNYAGMTRFLAIKLIQVFGAFYPFVSPFLGAIGTFLGGSDTTSNILFGNLQTEAGKGIGVSPIWLASANASGATGGKLVSLQNLTLAASGIDKKGEEGILMRMIFPYFAIYLVIMGLIVYIGTLL